MHNISDSTFEILADKSALFTSLFHLFLSFLFCWIDGLLILVSFCYPISGRLSQQSLAKETSYEMCLSQSETKQKQQHKTDNHQHLPAFSHCLTVKPASVQLLKDTGKKTKEQRNRWNSERERETEGVRKKVQGIPVVLHENGISFMDPLRTWRSSYMALRVTCSNRT